MSNIAQRVYQIMQDLPEDKAAEILDFAEFLKAKANQDETNFFAMAGFWEGRDVDQEQLRKQARPDRRARFSVTPIY